jgi:ACR3 family arsenite efflux pump ArsB
VFVCTSFAIGWVTAAVATRDPRDRFTIAAEFGTRNITVALAIAVTLLGRIEFARFATTYALVETPLLLTVVAVFRRYHSPASMKNS